MRFLKGITVRISRAPIDGASSPIFRLSLLGGFELTGPHGVVDLPSKKLAGLLAYLACTAPRPQSREKLSALFWGSHFDVQAKQNLRQALFRLRKVLGEDALESDGEVVSLNAAVVLSDVSRFEALVREGSRDALSAAADLYRGRLIDDVTVGEEGWSEWLAGERERLLELALGAMVEPRRTGAGRRPRRTGSEGRPTRHRAQQHARGRPSADRSGAGRHGTQGRGAQALPGSRCAAQARAEHGARCGRPGRSSPDCAASHRRADRPPSGRPPTVLPVADERRRRAGGRTPSAPQRRRRGIVCGGGRSGSSERRQLTIMACNIVDSMALSARLDPEHMRDLITAFHKAIDDVVSRFDGFVAQYLGDGVLVYFGYPAADEHDTEQAVRAGLAILDAVRTLKAGSDVPLQARVGIATGLVVVGEQLGTGDIGQARCDRRDAEPGGAAAGRGTAGRGRYCGQHVAAGGADVRLPRAGCHRREGAAAAGRGVAGARRERPASAASRRVAPARNQHWSAGSEEIDLLLRRWDQAKLGEGRVVLLSGEPGIGKSRIAESLLVRLEGEPHARLRYFCSPHHAQSPLYPLITQIEQAAGFEPGSDSRAKLDKLEALLKPVAKNLPRDVALIAELLGVPADERYPAVAVSPQQKREMTLTALLDQLAGAAAQGPVLIVVEDAHWIDPTSQDLLERMVARAASLPVLLVVTVRPELQPNWVGQPHVSMLPLNRLGRRDSAAIMAGVARDKALPDAVVDQVLAHADGVPLFIEELTSTLLESGVLRETAEGYALDGPLPELAIPTTLQASLVARLDRLASVKDVAQIGAAIGREFSHELIAAVSALAPIDLDAALERLTESGLISRRGATPDATYSFKHALVQDAAYATMLKSRRQPLHASIATGLIERFPALAETQPEVVAHHFTEAGLASEAIVHWLKAGRLARARSANREAVSSFERARSLLETLPESQSTLEQGCDLRLELRPVLLELGRSPRMLECLREAEVLAERLNDDRRRGRVYAFMTVTHSLRGELDEAFVSGSRALEVAGRLDDLRTAHRRHEPSRAGAFLPGLSMIG